MSRVPRVATGAPDATPAGDWPPNDLEAVSNCPACGAARRTVLYERLTDRVFRVAPGYWRLVRCGGCGSAYLDPRPTEANIGRAYAAYYTHCIQQATAPSRVRGTLLNAYLNARWGYKLRP